jgi:hydroxymethylpyrimidine pyrophosphatase-like HAD family hydrolase
MGKPFDSELEKIDTSYEWAFNIDIKQIQEFIFNDIKPLIIVGSGGSLSICNLISVMHKNIGYNATVVSPLGLFNSREIINNSKVILISSSGKNSDILFAYKEACRNNPIDVLTVCMKSKSKLSALILPSHSIWENDIPTGKDGFLATNTLLAYFIIFSRVYNEFINIPISKNFNISLPKSILPENLSGINTFSIIYGKWSEPVALDLESKITEAALGNVQFSDYRNFGHGRHHWFAKRKKDTSIIALITPYDKSLAEKTLKILPPDVKVIIIETGLLGYSGSIDLLIKSFYFINELGKDRGIDPGRPGVPEFGKRLYNLQYIKTLRDINKRILSDNEFNSISKKLTDINAFLHDTVYINQWKTYYDQFKNKINHTDFQAVIFDYDGTLCSSKNRFSGPSYEIFDLINKLLINNIIIGIATGRGKSVKTDLRRKIPKSYWQKIIVGYYNGTDISTLADDNSPNTKNTNKELKLLLDYFISFNIQTNNVSFKLRPNQLTIEPKDKNTWIASKMGLKEIFYLGNNNSKFHFLESCHSIDIIPINYSKNLVYNKCKGLIMDNNTEVNILCIGDRGDLNGNDFKLLSNKYSLSVDTVSSFPDSCWNFLPPGIKGEVGVLHYFSKIKIQKDQFTIKI